MYGLLFNKTMEKVNKKGKQMKKFLKLLSLALCFTLALSTLVACGNGSSGSGSGSQASGAGEQQYNIGVLQLVQHEALDAATKGFQDALTEKLGDKVSFNVQNAQGDSTTCATIANGFVSSDVDLILANTTISLQAASSATATIPILGTSVTDYGVALDLKDYNGTVGRNISGTSDLAPLDEQAAMVKELFPNAKTVGLIYCSAEPNSLYQVTVVKAELEGLGYTCTLYPFADSNDLAAVTTTAVASNEVIYVPTDNTVASNTGILDSICRPAGIPVVTGEKGIAMGCGVATLSIDYYDLGYKTGEMAYEVLTGQSDISTMPIAYAPNFTKMYNPTICEALGITIPTDYVPIED